MIGDKIKRLIFPGIICAVTAFCGSYLIKFATATGFIRLGEMGIALLMTAVMVAIFEID